MIAERIPQIQDLSPDEKMTLAAELWTEISELPEAEGPTPELIAAIRERMEFNAIHPTSTTAEVIARIRARHA